jgi:hypothetical protein
VPRCQRGGRCATRRLLARARTRGARARGAGWPPAHARSRAARGYRIKYADGDRKDMSASEVERTLRNMGQEREGQGRRGQGQLALRACKLRGGAPPAKKKKARVV